MNYLFLGDTHGDLDFVARAAEVAAENDAQIVQVGDWGFIWTHNGQVTNQVKQLSIELERAGEKHAKPPVVMRFIDGNHDHHPELRREALHADASGSVSLAHNVIYQPRGSVYEDVEGTRFLFVGGAPSIDKAYRTKGISWWPEETITHEDMEKAFSHENIHVLVTHDAHDYPPGYSPKGDPEFRKQSNQSLGKVWRLRKHYNPVLHVHGHWHYRYTDGVTIGLASNINRFNDALYLWSKNER